MERKGRCGWRLTHDKNCNPAARAWHGMWLAQNQNRGRKKDTNGKARGLLHVSDEQAIEEISEV